MAVFQSKRSVHPAQLREAARRNNRRASSRHPDRRKPAERRTQTRSSLPPRLKSRAYEALHDLHRGFEITHSSLERLERLDIVPPDHLRPCRYMAEELRALTNGALVAVLRDAESHDAAHFEKLRIASEQRPYPKLPGKKSK